MPDVAARRRWGRIFVGSFNVEERSLLLNTETDVVLGRRTLVRRLSGNFDDTFAHGFLQGYARRRPA